MYTDLNPPGEEPISLAETKTFLRVTDDAEDAHIMNLIASARSQVERRAETAMILRPVRLSVFARGVRARLPIAPVHTLMSVSVDGREVEAEVLHEPWGNTLHFPEATFGIARVDVLAGFGTSGEVPVPLRQAVLLLVADAFENREREAGFARTSLRIDALVGPYRGPRL